VVVESTLVAVGFDRPLETRLLSGLARIMWGLLLAYVLVRWADLAYRGAIGEALHWRALSVTFWVEMAGFMLPLALLARPADRRNPGRLFASAVLLVLGSMLLRLNSYLIGYETGDGWQYFPSLPELTLTVGFVAFEILAYILAIKLLPVLPVLAPPPQR
jgi:Ni/Fe-hydrogenase subunit HybB-like protein